MDDFTRPISKEGKSNQKAICEELKKASVIPDVIAHSPLMRTKQTAQVISDFFSVPMEQDESLGLEFDQEKLLKRIRNEWKEKTIFLIGHGPTLTHFYSVLTGKSFRHGEIARSCAVVIELEGDNKGKFLSYFQEKN